jgi:ribose/xylose/arabinose/galactoside ABC-type transport system permease subunit
MTVTEKTARSAPDAGAAPRAWAGRGGAWLRSQYPLVILVALVVVAAMLSDAFLSTRNLENLVLQMSVIGIVALAQFIVVVSGGIDISVGSVLGLACVLSAGLFGGSSVVVSVLVALGVGALLGAVNGFLVAFRGLEPFIVTLGMLALARGLVYAYTEGVPVRPADPAFTVAGTATVLGVPVLGILWVAVAVGMAFLLRRTVFGRRVYAVGSTREAAHASGVPVRGTLLAVYVIAGLLVGLGGFLLASRVGAGTPTAGTLFELDAIAAVVIGGARLAGGQGRVFGAVVGTAIFGVITNLLVLLNVSTFLQDAFRGALILLAVALATIGRPSTRRGH